MRMPTRATEAVIYFEARRPASLRHRRSLKARSDSLILRIQPDEGIVLKFQMKQPGQGFELKDVEMEFHYSDLTDVHLPSAYERLVVDAMLGSPMLYARGDVIESRAGSSSRPSSTPGGRIRTSASTATRPGPGVHRRPMSSSPATGRPGGIRARTSPSAGNLRPVTEEALLGLRRAAYD